MAHHRLLGQGIDKARDSGMFGFLRATGEMPSVLDHPGGRTEFFRFEAMLNQFSSPLPLAVLGQRANRKATSPWP